MEVAGLVLGAIPLVIWALENYVRPFRNSDNEHIVIETLRAGLELQQERIERIYERIGLDKPSDRELEDRLRELFPGMAENLLNIIRLMDGLVSTVLKDLKVDKQQQQLWAEPSDRMQFEWRKVKRKFKLKHCQKVLGDLRVWNGDLEKYLEKPEVPATTDGQAVQDLVLRFNAKRCNIVRESMNSFHRALSFHMGCTCRSPHQVTVQLDWSACEADSGVSKAAIHSSSLEPPEDCWRRLHVVPQIIPTTEPPRQLRPTLRTRLQAPTASVPRGRTPSPHPPRAPSPLSYAPVEIYNICGYLRDWNNIGSLHGFIRDPEVTESIERRFILKGSSKTQTSKSVTMSLPLKHLLNNRGKEPVLILTRKHKYGIAAALCWSVLHLSGSPWLENQLDAERAILLYSTSRQTLSCHPSLSCRLPALKSPARDEPTPRMPRSKTQTLVYSLGIALIELCTYNPVGSLLQVPSPNDLTLLLGDTAIPNDVMQELIERVRAEAGDAYGDAVERCITFALGGGRSKKNFESPEFRRLFYSMVVAPVQATYQMMPEMGDKYDD
ncbi:hypothetical protein B0T25DRAFT_496700 [Lasiosphaeria hispida]|uniref:DUF7580 domain-containing protein n=1 Tax=Lasiosphaeria hispida TaxID=260671 RepID=A0AAJ0MIV6_9PEZI|nr:hypothetical protein B0T25DRAFT_496700 [Lasiosphaeria hispida]